MVEKKGGNLVLRIKNHRTVDQIDVTFNVFYLQKCNMNEASDALTVSSLFKVSKPFVVDDKIDQFIQD